MAKRKSSRYHYRLLVSGISLFQMSAWGGEISDATLMDYRSRLSPKVQTQLEEVCGGHCPGFRIDAQSTRKPRRSIDELGFPDAAQAPEEAGAPERVVVHILADESVTASQVASLKQIIGHSVGNLVSEPVTVEVKKIKGVGEQLLRPPQRPPDFFDRFQQLEAGFWPATSIVLGVLALLALALVGTYIRRMIQDRHRSLVEPKNDSDTKALEEARPVTELDIDLEKILTDRAQDIQWFIDSAARETDQASLQKILSLVPSARLANLVSFNSKTLATLSEIPLPQVHVPKDEDKAWLVTALDQALWQRLHFESRPLARADFLSAYELQKLMSTLSSREEKALLLSHVKREKWASALVSLPSNERIEVGLLLQEIELGQLPGQDGLEKRLLETLHKNGFSEARYGHLVEDYSLYLDESEGRALMSQLSLKPRRNMHGLSLESVLDKLSDHLLLDLCLRANISELQVLFPTLPKATQDRILRTVPEHLRGRISRFSEEQDFDLDDDSIVLGARASIMSMTRGLNLLGPKAGPS
jgi:hypothetical protein